jgi:hypothetical protein
MKVEKGMAVFFAHQRPVPTINFKTFGLFEKSKRQNKCRPRIHIPSLDR